MPAQLFTPSRMAPPYMSHTPNVMPQSTGNDELDKLIEIAGYAYDPVQDIFYSVLDPWQRNFGYCRLYDEAAAPMGMIIDAEPIYFEYEGKKWMISVWKGQYDLVTGGEVGVYYEAFDIQIPGLFSGTFYNCADDDNLLNMSFVLRKNGKVLFTREGKHWWLTGFKLGEFSQPWELTMEVSIELKNHVMRDAFISGMLATGYSRNQIFVRGNRVSFVFDKPYTPQPLTRTEITDALIQKKNEQLCLLYHQLTDPFDRFDEKVAAIMEQAPEVYDKFFILGKTKTNYELALLGIMLGALLVTRIVVGSSQNCSSDSATLNTWPNPSHIYTLALKNLYFPIV